MLFPQPPGSERVFFEVAATLIPLLLFGGVLIERAKPPAVQNWKRRYAPLVLVPVVFGAIALLAEAFAIEAVVTGEASTPTRILVASVLVGGMTAVILAVSAPWLSRLEQSDHASYKWVAAVSVALLGVAALSAFGILIDGTNLAAQKEQLHAREKAIAKIYAEQDAVKRHSESLTLELNRLNRSLAIALGHKDTTAVKAFTNEIKPLNILLTSDREKEGRLLTEALQLGWEARGGNPLPPGVWPP